MGFLVELWRLILRLLGFRPNKQIPDEWEAPTYHDPSFRYEEERAQIERDLVERKREPFDVKASEERLKKSKDRREAFENEDD